MYVSSGGIGMDFDPLYTRDELQKEVQKSFGGFLSYFDEHSDNFIPDTNTLGQEAVERFEDENGEITEEQVLQNFNDILKELIVTETEIYNNYEKRMTQNTPTLFLDEFYKKSDEYQKIQEVFRKIEEIYESDKTFEEGFKDIYPHLYPIVALIAQSAAQGRKSRAGKNLEHHIENLLEIAGYDFERQIDNGESIVDLIIPSEEAFDKNPDHSALLACQTTIKDRHRLSLAKPPSGANGTPKRFILTGTGLDLFSNDEGDLTEKKINEIGNKGFRIVVFDKVKEKYPDNNSIISYSTFASRELSLLTKPE
jgi:hypothetical protein